MNKYKKALIKIRNFANKALGEIDPIVSKPNSKVPVPQSGLYYNKYGYGPYSDKGGRKIKEVEEFKDKLRATGDAISKMIANKTADFVVWMQNDTPAKNKLQVAHNQERHQNPQLGKISQLQEMRGLYFDKTSPLDKDGHHTIETYSNLTLAQTESKNWHKVQSRIKHMVDNHDVVAHGNNSLIGSRNYDSFVNSIPNHIIAQMKKEIEYLQLKAKINK